eukprot:15439387-Alexandrium_andersonii.AAC.1
MLRHTLVMSGSTEAEGDSALASMSHVEERPSRALLRQLPQGVHGFFVFIPNHSINGGGGGRPPQASLRATPMSR